MPGPLPFSNFSTKNPSLLFGINCSSNSRILKIILNTLGAYKRKRSLPFTIYTQKVPVLDSVQPWPDWPSRFSNFSFDLYLWCIFIYILFWWGWQGGYGELLNRKTLPKPNPSFSLTQIQQFVLTICVVKEMLLCGIVDSSFPKPTLCSWCWFLDRR